MNISETGINIMALQAKVTELNKTNCALISLLLRKGVITMDDVVESLGHLNLIKANISDT